MAETTEQYRARINQLKTSIENEPLIKKMRDDIAEGISKTGNRQADIEDQFKDVIEGTTGKDVISAPEIIAARKGEASLNARLTKNEQETTAQLAQTVDLPTLSETGRKLKIVAGVIRNSGSGWQFISEENGDVKHSHVNLASVTANNSEITVDFGFDAKNVLSFIASPDETLAQKGYFVGSSVGTNYAKIFLSKLVNTSVGGYIGYNGTTWDVSNASGVSKAEFVGGVLTVTHALITGYLVSVTGRGGKYRVNTGSNTNISTQVIFYDNQGNQLLTPTTDMKFNFTKQTVNNGATVVDPTTVAEPYGNIWCLGVFEV